MLGNTVEEVSKEIDRLKRLKAHLEHEDGRVKEYLKKGNGRPDIYIFDTCVNLIDEFLTYSWASGDSPRKVDDHCMDELRYYVMSRPRPAEKHNFSPVSADKARRIRRLKNARRTEH